MIPPTLRVRTALRSTSLVPGVGVHGNDNPSSCKNALESPGRPTDYGLTVKAGGPNSPIYAWTDLPWLPHKNNVSWWYCVVAETEPDCQDDATISCAPVQQNATI